MTQVFISYRRVDSQANTDRIYDKLVHEFGKRAIFKDVDDIPLGVNFPIYLDERVKNAKVVLIIIGRTWTSVRDNDGNLRLDNKNDFVRLEVEKALELDEATVIPVLVNGAHMPKPENFPPSLHGILELNAISIRNDPDFRNDSERLVRKLKELGVTSTKYAGWMVLGAILALLVIIISGTVFSMNNGATRPTRTPANAATEAILRVTNASLPTATITPNQEQTVNALSTEIVQTANAYATETALNFTDTPSPTPTATETPLPTFTSTPDLDATLRAQETEIALAATATAEIEIQNAQSTANAATNTPLPTLTPSETALPTATDSPTETTIPTVIPSQTPDLNATQTAEFNGTAIVNMTATAVREQAVATANAESAEDVIGTGICAFIFNDRNNNNTQETGEELLIGGQITLSDESGNTIEDYITDGSEPFCFEASSAGTYTIRGTAPDGYNLNNTALRTLNLTEGQVFTLSYSASTLDGVIPTGVITIGVNVRSAPSTEAELLGSVSAGSVITILARSSDSEWLKIEYYGDEAWVFAMLVDDLNMSLSAIPVEGADNLAVHDEENLLVNGGFDDAGNYIDQSIELGSSPPFAVASGWNGWFESEPRTESWMNLEPIAFPHTGDIQYDNIGNASQNLGRGDATFTGGVYQTVTIDGPASVRAEVWVYQDYPTASEASTRIGIDPQGGTDPSSTNIIWSDTETAVDTWVLKSVSTTVNTGYATDYAITVFIESRQEAPYPNNQVYYDAASLILQDITIHIVESGDTMASISVAYGVSQSVVLDANDLTREDARFLRIGQTLVIPTE